MESFWNERYSTSEYVYGIHPNEYFASLLTTLQPGHLLLPCEGEGRNAVFAASLGWQVDAFDYSKIGKVKAEALADENGVTIQYDISGAEEYKSDNQYDVIAFIYAHFPSGIRSKVFRHLCQFLKPGGLVIIEAFNKQQLGLTSGGPKDKNMLYSKALLEGDFTGFNIQYLDELEVNLQEGDYHKGKAQVVRMLAQKQH